MEHKKVSATSAEEIIKVYIACSEVHDVIRKGKHLNIKKIKQDRNIARATSSSSLEIDFWAKKVSDQGM